jgi:hypothetical protein
MDFTSRHGHPVRVERGGVLAGCPAPSTALFKTMVREKVVDTGLNLIMALERLLHL